MGANSRNQFRTACAITAHQRIDEWQKDFVGSEPFGAAPIELIEALLRQLLERLGDEGRLADHGFSSDKSHLPFAGQDVPRHLVDRREGGGPADHQGGDFGFQRYDRVLDLPGRFPHRADKADAFAR